MAQYIERDGEKWVQFDDGTIAPVFLPASLADGLKIELLASQLAALQNPTLPTEYALPASQVGLLQNVSVGNFPLGFAINNFPASYQVANMPSVFPISGAQEAILSSIDGVVSGFETGAGSISGSTLRVTEARDSFTPNRPTPVPAAIIDTPIVAASASRKLLWLYNNSSAICYLGIGSQTVSAADFTQEMVPKDRLIIQGGLAALEYRAIWTAAAGSMMITVGT